MFPFICYENFEKGNFANFASMKARKVIIFSKNSSFATNSTFSWAFY